MKLEDFFDRVEEHETLKGYYIGDTYVVVKHHNTYTELGLDAIIKNSWELLEEVLLGKREPHVLYHMSRVVGYYSRTDNWNKSKIGELKDRHKGNYTLEGGSDAAS